MALTAALRLHVGVAALILWAAHAPAETHAQTGAVDRARLDALERTISAEPENLKVAAEYRQLSIAAGTYNRSIDLFEKLAKAKNAGPNVQISLALAYVDKVPPSGDFRRWSLARDAVSALTRSIERRPTVLAYYVRGLINLYFNKAIFNRVPRAIADLEKARAILTDDIPPAARARVYTSLGDAYWENEQRDKAREAWRAGAEKYPDDGALRSRLVPDEAEAARAVRRALDPATRVDTSLRELFPS